VQSAKMYVHDMINMPQEFVWENIQDRAWSFPILFCLLQTNIHRLSTKNNHDVFILYESWMQVQPMRL
jgi:hypothetical protein